MRVFMPRFELGRLVVVECYDRGIHLLEAVVSMLTTML